MSACRDGHSTRLDCMHLGALWGHGRVPNHSTSHHISPPLINCLLKLLPPSLPPSLVSSVGPAGHSAAAAGESWEYKNQQWGPARAHEPAAQLAQHRSYKNSNPQCRFGPKLKSPRNTNIFSNLGGGHCGR